MRFETVVGGLLLTVVLATLAVTATGCGGGSRSPSVARLGVSSSTSSSASGSPSSSGSSEAHLLQFAQCMRSHGFADYPDPIIMANGQPGFDKAAGSSDLNPHLAKVQAALNACRHYAGFVLPSASQRSQARAQMLKYSECMRLHGLPDFPDPNAQGELTVSGIDPNSPQYQASHKACASLAAWPGAGAAGP
jgi:hypothetical protein